MQQPVYIEPGCPWHELSLVHLPNIHWCEEILCSWVVNPANTWSNLAYIFAALWILRRARLTGRKELRWLGLATVIMGVASFVWHMSYTYVLQILDFAGMFLFLILILLIRLAQMRRLRADSIRWMWLAGTGVASALMAWAGFQDYPIQGAILAMAAVGVAVEVQALRELRRGLATGARGPWPATARWILGEARYLVASLALALAAVTLSALDVSGTLCDPTNHWFQGHATWHVLTALAVGFWVRHLELMPSPFLRR